MIASLLARMALAGTEPGTDSVRLAVILSSNDGAAGEERLLYADSDAHRVRDVLVEMGGFLPEDVWEVPDATIDAVTLALGKAVLRASALRASGKKVSLVVYYTGHAGADGLHLGEEVLPLYSLKTAARVVPADERVFVVDACQAGQILRSMGATLVEVADGPAEFAPPDDEAWIASAGAEERAFEVDRRRGALFTHFFVSGARGAADLDVDGKITLAELYGFVQARTAETAADLGHVQRPRWAGALGSFVLSDLERAPAGIVARGPIPEPLLVVSERHGTVVAEIPAGAGGKIMVPPGAYQLLSLGNSARTEVGRVEVPQKGYAQVALSDLRVVRSVRTKGGLVDLHPFGLAAGYGLGTAMTPGRLDGHGVWISARQGLGRGHELDFGLEAARLSFQTRLLQGSDTALSGWVGWSADLLPGALHLGPSADVGLGWLRQQVARRSDPVWGEWYGQATGERVSSSVTLRAHAGLAGVLPLDLPGGWSGTSLLASVGLGPSLWPDQRQSWRMQPDLRVRIGLEVAP